ncbi:hypothetical protein [Butyrivibrio sp. MC2013]|uniref:hypothetical protein n=1 Tax=Butyrivibrio sp. MC2013 TaxID=1280686 RepID=UPI000411F877|nr:hypothetical protein [Butyrivibrio sp. MC2013]
MKKWETPEVQFCTIESTSCHRERPVEDQPVEVEPIIPACNPTDYASGIGAEV